LDRIRIIKPRVVSFCLLTQHCLIKKKQINIDLVYLIIVQMLVKTRSC
jgi:hypothetical protein